MKKTLSALAPQTLYNYQGEQFIERLLTNPEMESVWKALYEWWDEWTQKHEIKWLRLRPENDHDAALFVQYDFDLRFSRDIKEIARRCHKDSLGVLALTEPARQKLADKIATHAIQLSRALREWDAPMSLSHYIHPSVRYGQLLNTLTNFADIFGDEEINVGICELHDHPEIDHDSPSGRVHNFIWDEVGRPEVREFSGHLSSDDPTIYDVLELLAASKSEHLRDPIVQRGQDQNKRRLFGIRTFASFVYKCLGRDPSRIAEREIIATFVRAVLDDPEVGEDTVKDALKNYDLSRD